MFVFSIPPPLTLYIHFPWCIRKCPYCDFNSHAIHTAALPEDEYIDALILDLESELQRIWGRRIMSIFLGGGTPGLFSEKTIRRLLSVLRSYLNLPPSCEITLEANPGTVDASRFSGYREAGVNRLSIGVQSFNDEMLKRLGRIHDGEQAIQALEQARTSGFENINMDLMYGLPGQSVEDAAQDLETAVKFETLHLSWYQLTLEPNTVFFSSPPELPEDDVLWQMQSQGISFLAENGLQQYEISAYARESNYCIHNMNYWQFGDYLGIGAGAHGKITDCSNGTITRYARHRIPAAYMKHAGKPGVIVQEKQLSQSDTVLEFMMNSMRLSSGIPKELFTRHTGLSPGTVEPLFHLASKRGLLEEVTDIIKPTPRGHRYLNDLLQLFMEPAGPLGV